MVGRYGGEEFLVVLNKCDPSSAVARAENLRNIVAAKPILLSTKSVTVTISIGVALTTDFPNRDADDILHAADMALYAAKEAGRNCIRLAQPGSLPQAPEAPHAESPVLISNK
jgi:diguanylate cyclase (GGDEF)-like protein